MAFVDWLWIGGGCIAVAMVLTTVWVLIRLAKRSHRGVRLEPDWQARAEAMELRATQAEATVRAGVIPLVARFLQSKFVVGLLRQRADLIQVQTDTTQKVVELEQRLADAHSRVQDRLEEYEQQAAASRQLQASPEPAAATPRPIDPTPPLSVPRRNPLRAPTHLSPEPSAVQFSDIMARKKAAAGQPPRNREARNP